MCVYIHKYERELYIYIHTHSHARTHSVLLMCLAPPIDNLSNMRTMTSKNMYNEAVLIDQRPCAHAHTELVTRWRIDTVTSVTLPPPPQVALTDRLYRHTQTNPGVVLPEQCSALVCSHYWGGSRTQTAEPTSSNTAVVLNHHFQRNLRTTSSHQYPSNERKQTRTRWALY